MSERAPQIPATSAEAGSPTELAAAVAARKGDALRGPDRTPAPEAAAAPVPRPQPEPAAPSAEVVEPLAPWLAAVAARLQAKADAMPADERARINADRPELPLAPRPVEAPRPRAATPRAAPPHPGSRRPATLRDWQAACLMHDWLGHDWARMVLTTGVSADELRQALAGLADARQARHKGAVGNPAGYLKACCQAAVAARSRR